MKKLTSLLLALIMLFTAITLSGCGERYAIEEGHFEFETLITPTEKMGVRLKTDTFEKSDVEFNLYVGLQKTLSPFITYIRDFIYGGEPKSIVPDEWKNREYVIGICHTSDLNEWKVEEDEVGEITLTDVIDGMYIIEAISCMEVVTKGEFNYYTAITGEMNYSYIKSVKVPTDFIDNEMSFSIVLFSLDTINTAPIYVHRDLTFHYEFNNDTVTFTKVKYH